MKSTLAVVLSFCLVAGTTTPTPSNILIWGDSIAQLNFPYLDDLIGHKVNLALIPENAGNSERSLEHLEEWFSHPDGDVEIVFYNTGIHDTRFENDNPGFIGVPLDEYETNTRAILEYMVARANIVIVRASTSIAEPNEFGIFDADIDARNEVLRNLAAEYGLEYFDLNTLIDNDPNIHLNPGGVHHMPESRPFIARHMAKPLLTNWLVHSGQCAGVL